MKPRASTILIAGIGILASLAIAARPVAEPADASKPEPFSDNACVQCHRDIAGRSAEIVHLEWRSSVHYTAGVGCDGCHGGNPAVRREQFPSDDAFKHASHMDRNPEFLLLYQGKEFVSDARGRSVSYFCGKCHAKIKEQHLGSPHGEFGDPTCLYCHGQGSHKITDPTVQIIDTRSRAQQGRCSPCHRSNTMEAVARIKGIIIEAEAQIESSRKQYAQLEAWGYHNIELEKMHHQAREVRSQLRQIFHSFNMRDINGFAAEIQAAVDRTSATYEMIEHLRKTQRQQTIIGAVAVALLLCFAALLWYYKHAFLEHDRAAAAADFDEVHLLEAAAGGGSRHRETALAGLPNSEKEHHPESIKKAL